MLVAGNRVVVGRGQALNRDSETQAIFDERSSIEFMKTPQLND